MSPAPSSPSMMTAVPPPPPEIAAQQQASPVPMFSQIGAAGGGIPNPVAVLQMKMAELEQWAQSIAPLLTQINPALSTLLVPIAKAGAALQQEVADMQQRTSGPSPQVAGTVPPNLPGNIPDGRPAA